MVAPTITINGRDIAGRFVRAARHVGVAQVRIEWGRGSIFDKPQPGVAKVRILNRGIGTTPHQKGDAITIAHPSYGHVFRGTIADTDTTVDYLHHANGLREKISETTIIAHDPGAAIGQFIPTGPATPTSVDAGAGEGGWVAQYSGNRINAIMAAGTARFVDSYLFPSSTVQTSPLVVTATAAAQPPADETALDLLHGAYSMYRPLSTFTYDPNLHRLVAAHLQPAETAIVTLTAAGASLSITLPAGTEKLPANLAEIESIKLGMPADDVAVVRLEHLRLDTYIENGVYRYEYIDAAASQDVPAASSGRTFTAPQSPMYFTSTGGAQSLVESNRYRSWWLDTAATIFASINNTAQLPALRIDPEAPELATFDQAFRTYQRARSYYLNGSMFNGDPGAPSVVQFIGGVLEYSETGWSHTLMPAVTAGGAPATMTLAQLFPAIGDRLDSWADDLTINDLAAAIRRA